MPYGVQVTVPRVLFRTRHAQTLGRRWTLSRRFQAKLDYLQQEPEDIWQSFLQLSDPL